MSWMTKSLKVEILISHLFRRNWFRFYLLKVSIQKQQHLVPSAEHLKVRLFNRRQRFGVDKILLILYVVFLRLVRDAHQRPEEKRLIWWRFSQVVESDWRNSSWAAGQPRSPEALSPCPEGRPARCGELQVCWQLWHNQYFNHLFEIFCDSELIGVADFPTGVTSRRARSFPAQSHVLMGRMTFLMTYKVSPLITTHSRHTIIDRAYIRFWMLNIRDHGTFGLGKLVLIMQVFSLCRWTA